MYLANSTIVVSVGRVSRITRFCAHVWRMREDSVWSSPHPTAMFILPELSHLEAVTSTGGKIVERQIMSDPRLVPGVFPRQYNDTQTNSTQTNSTSGSQQTTQPGSMPLGVWYIMIIVGYSDTHVSCSNNTAGCNCCSRPYICFHRRILLSAKTPITG